MGKSVSESGKTSLALQIEGLHSSVGRGADRRRGRAHPDRPTESGGSEAEITEAVEVGYLYGGTAALVMGANAFRSS
jgi:hypothetical protein